MTAPLEDPPHFLVVGSPRSGTTLVQRLLSELPGVQVTPETHFYSLFFEAHLRHERFPLTEERARELLTTYAALPQLHGTRVDVEEVLRRSGDRPGGAHALFGAVVGSLAPAARMAGEKTPDHLRWWSPISAAAPGTRIVAVLRDPRAVVASALRAPFGMSRAALVAAAWCQDVAEIESARRTLPGDRLLVVRYEEVVARPDDLRQELGRFLGAEDGVRPIAEQQARLFPEGESAWKQRAVAEVDPARAAAWREDLEEEQLRQVELVAGRVMRRHGYEPELGARARVGRALGPGDVLRLSRLLAARRRQRRRIQRTDLGGGYVAGLAVTRR